MDTSVAAGSSFQEAYCRLELARGLLAADGAAAETEIRAQLDRSLVLVGETGSIPFEPRIRASYAQLARALGDEDTAEREVAQARRRLAEMGAVADAERLLAGAPAAPG